MNMWEISIVCYCKNMPEAIAATSVETTIKYWEIPAAGCLTFMEITEKNKGRLPWLC